MAASINRRNALRLAVCAGLGLGTALLPAPAGATSTKDKLDAAQLSYDEAQAELDAIDAEIEELAGTLAETQGKVVAKQGEIDSKQTEIDTTQASIDEKQSSIEDKQSEIEDTQSQIEDKQSSISDRISMAYKTGNQSALDVLLNSASFEELTSNIYYLDRISSAERTTVEEVKTLKASLETQKSELETQKSELETQKSNLETQKSELETQKSELETLQAQQEEELSAVQAKQTEASDLVDSLSDEVKALTVQYDAELEAARQAAIEAAKRNNNGGASGKVVITGSGNLAAVQTAAYNTPSPGSGLCAAWVSNVFSNAGIGTFYGNADTMYYAYCGYSTDAIQPGMIIAVNTAPYSAAARRYGHVGIYMGEGVVRDNASGVLRTSTLQAWISEYSVTSTVLCGWLGGVVLS